MGAGLLPKDQAAETKQQLALTNKHAQNSRSQKLAGPIIYNALHSTPQPKKSVSPLTFISIGT